MISWAACYGPVPALPLTSHLSLLSNRFAAWIRATWLGEALSAEVCTIAAGLDEGYTGCWDDCYTRSSQSPTNCAGAESRETGWGPAACLRNIPHREDHDLGESNDGTFNFTASTNASQELTTAMRKLIKIDLMTSISMAPGCQKTRTALTEIRLQTRCMLRKCCRITF